MPRITMTATKWLVAFGTSLVRYGIGNMSWNADIDNEYDTYEVNEDFVGYMDEVPLDDPDMTRWMNDVIRFMKCAVGILKFLADRENEQNLPMVDDDDPQV